jgi:energy-coupling factor transporter ATP-binding protein EcfA2
MLDQLGLGSHRRKLPGVLSGGERQRLAIARAVVNRPTVLLADEPTGALDRANGASALALLEDLNRRGQTILLVTHDEALAAQSAHRIVRLIDGRVVDDARHAAGGVMGALSRTAAAGLRRRRLQSIVLAAVLLLSSAAGTLALSILVESRAPFDTAFTAANGAHLVIDYAPGTDPAALHGQDPRPA